MRCLSVAASAIALPLKGISRHLGVLCPLLDDFRARNAAINALGRRHADHVECLPRLQARCFTLANPGAPPCLPARTTISALTSERLNPCAAKAHKATGDDRFDCPTCPNGLRDRSRLQARLRSAQCGHIGFAEALRHDPVYPFGDIRALLPPAPPVRPVRDRSLPPSTA